MDLTITQAKISKDVNYVISSFYPTIKEIVHFAYHDKKRINKDSFMTGIWKLKNLKNK